MKCAHGNVSCEAPRVEIGPLCGVLACTSAKKLQYVSSSSGVRFLATPDVSLQVGLLVNGAMNFLQCDTGQLQGPLANQAGGGAAERGARRWNPGAAEDGGNAAAHRAAAPLQQRSGPRLHRQGHALQTGATSGPLCSVLSHVSVALI